MHRIAVIPAAAIAGLAVTGLWASSLFAASIPVGISAGCWGRRPPTWTSTTEPPDYPTDTPRTTTFTYTPPRNPTSIPPTPTPPRTSVPGSPRPGTGTPTTGGPDVAGPGPSGPTGPRTPGGRAAGTDWHDWWGPTRLRWWRDQRRTADSGSDGADTLPAGTPAWPVMMEQLIGKRALWTDKAALAEGLAYGGDPAALDLALRLVGDRHDEVARLGVFAAAAAMGDGSGTMQALRTVLGDRTIDAHPRGAAAAAMGALGDRAALAPLLKIVRSPADDIIRVGAVTGLGYCADAATTAQLARVLADRREDTPVRTAAVVALGLVASGADDAAAAAAIQTLLTTARTAGRLPGEVRQTLALNLAQAGPTPEALRTLTTLVQEDSDLRTRAMAAVALGRIAQRARDSHPAIVRALTARWDKEPPSVKAFLALSLGLGGCTGERRRLEAWLLGRGDPLHRGAAAVGLGLMGDPAAIGALRKTCNDAPPRLRGDAAEALGYLGGPAAATVLRGLLKQRSAALQGAAIYGLGLIGQARDRQLILQAMGSSSADVRLGAVYAMAAFGGAGARDRLLIHASVEGNPDVRSMALWSAAMAAAPRPLAAPGKDLDRSPWARSH